MTRLTNSEYLDVSYSTSLIIDREGETFPSRMDEDSTVRSTAQELAVSLKEVLDE